jgi:hypothetical protein
MSQNDFVIANDTAANVRADLNLALQALASQSSGATAPATTYANMLWYDTAANFLYMRSEADDAWIKLGTLNQSTNTFSAEVTLPTLATSVWETGTATDESLISPAKLAAGIAAGAGDSGVEVISTTVITTAVSSVDFTGFDATKYTSYEIELMNVKPSNDNVTLRMLTSSDGGSTYDSGFNMYRYGVSFVTSLSESGIATSSNSATYIELTAGFGNASGEDGGSGSIRIIGPHLAKSTLITCLLNYFNATNRIVINSGGAARLEAADVDGARVYFSAGNIASGTIVFRGIK